MPNTVIALKKSATPSATPSDLANGELAINFTDGKLFYKHSNGSIVQFSSGSAGGDSFGTVNANGTLVVADTSGDVLSLIAGSNIQIVGDAINDTITISATGGDISPAFAQANTARDHANAAFAGANAAIGQANTARDHANTAHATGNAALIQANTARTHANTAHETANAAITQANTARTHANSAFDQANTARDHANSALTQANTARTHANTAHLTANAAFDKANNALPISGGTITGNLSVVGALTVSGNTYSIDAENLRVSDPLIYLAGNNYVSDIVDIGFIGNYVNSTGQNVHTGLYREHEDKMYYLFQGYDKEPANNHIVALSNNMSLAVLNADLRTSNILLANTNTVVWIRSTFDQANTARDHANSSFAGANASFVQANTSRLHANASFLQANTARDHANAAFEKANTSGGAAYFSGNNGDVGSASGLGDIFRVHTNTLTANVTIYSGNNALAAGPISISLGKVLTIQDGARVVIV